MTSTDSEIWEPESHKASLISGSALIARRKLFFVCDPHDFRPQSAAPRTEVSIVLVRERHRGDNNLDDEIELFPPGCRPQPPSYSDSSYTETRTETRNTDTRRVSAMY